MKMWFPDIMNQVAEDAHGANGEMDREERIKRCSESLVDHVHEALAELDCGCGGCSGEKYRLQIPHEAYRFIRRLVASAMVHQFDHAERTWRETIRMNEVPFAPR
jgi:hypothetical protein